MQENENIKAKSKKKLLVAIISIVLVVAVLSGVLIYFAVKPKGDKEKNKTQQTGKKPVGVHAYLVEEGKKCGYKNAFSELSEDWATTSGDLTYSRYQQNYKGIPVYGQTVVGVTDKDGNVISVTGNVEDVNEEISTTPTVKKADIDEKINTYLSEEYDITDAEIKYDLSDKNLCIFGLYDYADTLCYDLDVELTLTEGTTNIQMIVNATDGSIIYSDSGLRFATVKKDVTGDQGRKYENVTYTDDNGTYKLIDSERKITAYYPDQYIKIVKDNNYTVFSGDGSLVPIWNEDVQVDQVAIDAYANLQIAYDYFENLFNIRSLDGNGNIPIDVYIGIQYMVEEDKIKDFSNNAFYNTGDYFGVGLYEDDQSNSAKYLDIMAHEYMHGIEHHRSGMTYEGESAAVMEAVSDIFGELVEAWHLNKAPDWKNKHRNHITPNSNNYPERYFGDNWKDGDRYNNSAVITHTAYLMWKNGFTTEELAKLWYNAMLMMPTDCNFYECRELVELAARNLGFSEDKQAVIDDAFDKVNIKTDDTVEEIEIKSNCDISVLDFVGDEYDDYTISIWHVDINGKYPETSNPLRSFVENKKIIKIKTPYKANLKEGVYVLELIDNEIDINGEQKKVYKYLIVTDNGEEKVNIDADFGLINIKGTVTDSEDKPVEGATVKLCVGDKYGRTYYKATTDSSGKYELNSIPYSDDFVYEEIFAEKDGMKQTISEPTLTRNNKIDFELVLKIGDIRLYIPILEDEISSFDYSDGSCYLYDIDADKTQELILIGSYPEIDDKHFSATAYTIYDIEDEKVVKLLDKRLLFYNAGGPSAQLSVVQYNEELALMVSIDHGETGNGAHRNTNYTLYDFDEYNQILTASMSYVDQFEIDIESCFIDDKECDNYEFARLMDSIKVLCSAEYYKNESSDGSKTVEGLIEYIETITA